MLSSRIHISLWTKRKNNYLHLTAAAGNLTFSVSKPMTRRLRHLKVNIQSCHMHGDCRVVQPASAVNRIDTLLATLYRLIFNRRSTWINRETEVHTEWGHLHWPQVLSLYRVRAFTLTAGAIALQSERIYINRRCYRFTEWGHLH